MPVSDVAVLILGNGFLEGPGPTPAPPGSTAPVQGGERAESLARAAAALWVGALCAAAQKPGSVR